MKKPTFFILVLLSSNFNITSPAQAFVKMGNPETVEIKGIALSSSAQIDEKSTPLKRVTQGLRQKKVVLAWFSVYVAQFFSNSPVDLKSVAAFKESLLKGLPVVVTMTFVRDVDNEKIVEGFKEVFKENKIDSEMTAYKNYLDAVKASGDIKDRQVFTFVFQQEKGKESVHFQTRGKELFAVNEQPGGTISNFLSMWLGKPIDSGLEQLQEQVLKP